MVFLKYHKDSITFCTIVMGIIRAGYVPFPISPRNSPAAVAHLLSTKEVSHLLVGGEHSLQNLATASSNLMKASTAKIPTSLMPIYDDLYVSGEGAPFNPLPFKRPAIDEVIIILHSSGMHPTTGCI